MVKEIKIGITYYCHLLSMSAAVGLGPLHLAGVSAQLVVSTALALTKADDLGVQTRAVSFEFLKLSNSTL